MHSYFSCIIRPVYYYSYVLQSNGGLIIKGFTVFMLKLSLFWSLKQKQTLDKIRWRWLSCLTEMQLRVLGHGGENLAKVLFLVIISVTTFPLNLHNYCVWGDIWASHLEWAELSFFLPKCLQMKVCVFFLYFVFFNCTPWSVIENVQQGNIVFSLWSKSVKCWSFWNRFFLKGYFVSF